MERTTAEMDAVRCDIDWWKAAHLDKTTKIDNLKVGMKTVDRTFHVLKNAQDW